MWMTDLVLVSCQLGICLLPRKTRMDVNVMLVEIAESSYIHDGI